MCFAVGGAVIFHGLHRLLFAKAKFRQFLCHGRSFSEKLLELLLALNFVLLVLQPRATLVDNAAIDGCLQHTAFPGNALTEYDVKLAASVGGCKLVLGHLDFGPDAVWRRCVAQNAALRSPDLQADARVVLHSIASTRHLRRPVSTDICSKLVGKEQRGVVFPAKVRDLPAELTHDASQKTNRKLAHVFVELFLGGKSCHAVDNNNLIKPGLYELDGQVRGILCGARVEEVPQLFVDAELDGIVKVKRTLGVDKSAPAALVLHSGNARQGHGCLAALLRAIDLHDPTKGQTTSKRQIHSQGPSGEGIHIHLESVHGHHGSFAVLLVYLALQLLELGGSVVAFHRLRVCLSSLLQLHDLLRLLCGRGIFHCHRCLDNLLFLGGRVPRGIPSSQRGARCRGRCGEQQPWHGRFRGRSPRRCGLQRIALSRDSESGREGCRTGQRQPPAIAR
mmetsp:Transcript_64587/g.116195  ORF Transcript_64587/g.116195 Transcript_64587/m.116195 type:complete len:449 (-) Transcript_64587:65-1411(-)